MHVPYYGDFPGGLGIGKAVRFRGYVKDDAERFEINLACDEDGKTIGLNFYARFDEEDVVLNSFEYDAWRKKEKVDGEFPFEQGKYYDVLFVAHDGHFYIYVNETYFTEFKFRVPVENLLFVDVKGDVTLMDVEFTEPLPDDFMETIPSGIKKHDYIVVKGFFYGQGDRFSINLHYGDSIDDDIALHFNPRRDEGQVVLNSRSGGKWKKEERHPLPQCLQDAVYFELEVYAKKDSKFEIYINHDKFASFKARGNIEDIRGINVEGEAYIHVVKFHPTVDLPFVADIPAPLEADSWVNFLGIPKEDPLSLAINFQCGDDDDYGSDVAFHFNPRFNGEGTIMNTLKGGSWGDDEQEESNFPFTPTELFEIDIQCLPDMYRVFVDHGHYADFAHRISLSHVSHIMLTGDCDFFEPEFD